MQVGDPSKLTAGSGRSRVTGMGRDACNQFRYDASERGHYESYFLRANHPSRKLAIWIRYTVLSHKNRARDAVGEIWAVYFDGERNLVAAVKEVVPLSQCEFSPHGLRVRIGGATLEEGSCAGSAAAQGNRIEWRLAYETPDPPVLLLQERYYGAAFPKAKAVVSAPQARFRGVLSVNDAKIDVDGWIGSQNHNWGSQHTDRYAWGQVCGFDNAPESFLEIATARIRIGPPWSPLHTPWMTTAVLRHEGHEYKFNGLACALRADARYDFFSWVFRTQTREASMEGRIEAEPADFVGLYYGNPPGGRKICLNTKIARGELSLKRPGMTPAILATASRAALEILTDRTDHGVGMLDC